MRKLASGREVEEETEEVVVIKTKCPRKWVCIDLEDRFVWVKGQCGYRTANTEEQEEALKILKRPR